MEYEGEKNNIVVPVKSPEETEANLKEKMIRKRSEEEMKNGLPKHMDYEGNALPENTEAKTDSCSINYTKTIW